MRAYWAIISARFRMLLQYRAAAVAGGACLFSGIFVLQATMAFWTTESLEILNTLTYGGVETAQYPVWIYRPWFRRFFTMVIPLACINYFPALAILGRADPSSPLFGRPYLEVRMGRLDRGRALGFLEAGFSEAGVGYRRDELEEAVDALDGVIGWLTAYGYRALSVGHRTALGATVEEGARLVAGELGNFLAPRARARDRYLVLLRLVSVRPMGWGELRRGLQAEVGRVDDKTLARYLRALMDYGFLERRDDGTYTPTDPLIPRALRYLRSGRVGG